MVYNTLFAQINIWKDSIPKMKVELYPYIAENNNGSCVIICPGGSYFWHGMNNEGHNVAQWFNKHGISAFVLKYRTAKFPAFLLYYRYLFRGNRYPDAQNDLQQTISHIKANANEYNIDTNKIGLIGFSAGGHLVLSTAMFFLENFRPLFIASIYPVVTMKQPLVHKRSKRALLGEDQQNNQALIDSLSLENHTNLLSCPIFIASCKDDPTVDYRNSLLLDSALTKNNIPHIFHLYEEGGHGFGISNEKGSTQSRTWKQSLLYWIKDIKNDNY